VMGMPVNPDFIKPPSVSRDEFREHLGLSKDRPTVCINGGWAGGGNMLDIYQQLSRVKRQVQCIFLCGHNKQLYEMVKKEARKSSIPTAVLPFHDRMSDLMSAVDLMVTKAGGLTTFEAIARRLPLAVDMITKPMPQEIGTVEIVVEEGLAKPVARPSDIIDIVEQLQVVKDRSSVKLPSNHQLDRVDAVYNIARAILGSLVPAKRSGTGTYEQFQTEGNARP
jgi:processive 1,2-diacylglycerol beta-glucosyltransferase